MANGCISRAKTVTGKETTCEAARSRGFAFFNVGWAPCPSNLRCACEQQSIGTRDGQGTQPSRPSLPKWWVAGALLASRKPSTYRTKVPELPRNAKRPGHVDRCGLHPTFCLDGPLRSSHLQNGDHPAAITLHRRVQKPGNVAVLRCTNSHATIRGSRNRDFVDGRVAKQADAQDLKSCGMKIPCGFEPRLGY